MTKPAAIIDQEARKTFESNLDAFKLYNPHLYAPLRSHKPRARIVVGDDGALDVMDGEKSMYGGDAIAFVRERLAAFDASPIHIATSPPEAGTFDRYANPFVAGMKRDAQAAGITFHSGLPASKPFNLFIFGVGLGFHIDHLIERHTPTFTLVIERDLDILYQSLFTFDWATALERAFKSGGGLYVSVESETTLTVANINQIISENCPAGLDGTPCFIFSDEEYATFVLQQVLANGPLMLAGLGYLFDETKMMRNTYVNLRGKNSKLIKRREKPALDAPVFVIGAGPSLDHDFDVIREWQDRAIIISTGTAIRSLLVHGIRPDLHVEMENMHVYSSLKPLSEEYDLSGICLVVSTTIEPHIVSFFDEVLFYFRQWTSPYPLFCESPLNALRKPGPLVVNVSFSLALDIGAKNIFMFGTDFGTRGEGLDHAKDNVLFTEGAVIGFTQVYDRQVAPNFDGTFFASEDFQWGLKAIRETIQLYGRDCRIANCSDGAFVEGATPLRASDVEITTSPETKQRDLIAVKKRSEEITPAWFDSHWNPDALRAEINRFTDEALSIFKNPESFADNVYLERFMALSRDIPLNRDHPGSDQFDRTRRAVAELFRGSIDMFLICVRYYLGRVSPAGKQTAFAAIIATRFEEQLARMHDAALDVIDHPENILPAKESGAWEEKDVIEETSYTWGNVSRNEPCPCGSGKRYKHCHGAG